MSQGHNVYKVQYQLGLQDPLVPGIEYHTGIFIETDTDGGRGGGGKTGPGAAGGVSGGRATDGAGRTASDSAICKSTWVFFSSSSIFARSACSASAAFRAASRSRMVIESSLCSRSTWICNAVHCCRKSSRSPDICR